MRGSVVQFVEQYCQNMQTDGGKRNVCNATFRHPNERLRKQTRLLFLVNLYSIGKVIILQLDNLII